MKVEDTLLAGCKVFTPPMFEDHRGWFMESFNHRRLTEALGKEYKWVQDNHSLSNRGVLRGLHFQAGEHAQTKLVRVIQGEILDVAVDLRKDSTTYKQYFRVRLSAQNRKQLFIPKGFAHGFVVLSETAEVLYKCDHHYAPQAEQGIRFDDPDLSIDWTLKEKELNLSDKDLVLPFLKQWENA